MITADQLNNLEPTDENIQMVRNTLKTFIQQLSTDEIVDLFIQTSGGDKQLLSSNAT